MWGLSTAQNEKDSETGRRGAEERRESRQRHAGEDLGDPRAPTTDGAPPRGSGV